MFSWAPWLSKLQWYNNSLALIIVNRDNSPTYPFLTACDCDANGAKSQKCDDKGKCIDCNPFITGNKCEICVTGHINFPKCDKCANGYYGYPNCKSKYVFNVVISPIRQNC